MKKDNSYLHQRNVLEFRGVLYYDGDLSTVTCIIIDGCGSWSYYQRAPGDTEGTEVSHGAFSCSIDGDSTYYTDSAAYPGLSIHVFEFGEGILL